MRPSARSAPRVASESATPAPASLPRSAVLPDTGHRQTGTALAFTLGTKAEPMSRNEQGTHLSLPRGLGRAPMLMGSRASKARELVRGRP